MDQAHRGEVAEPKKVRSNHGVNTLFHFDRAPAKQTAFYWQRVKNVKTSLRMETAGRPNSANGNKNGGRFGESSNEKENGAAGSGATWTGSLKGVFAERKHNKPRLALNNFTAGVREREDENRTRVAGHLDESRAS